MSSSPEHLWMRNSDGLWECCACHNTVQSEDEPDSQGGPYCWTNGEWGVS